MVRARIPRRRRPCPRGSQPTAPGPTTHRDDLLTCRRSWELRVPHLDLAASNRSNRKQFPALRGWMRSPAEARSQIAPRTAGIRRLVSCTLLAKLPAVEATRKCHLRDTWTSESMSETSGPWAVPKRPFTRTRRSCFATSGTPTLPHEVYRPPVDGRVGSANRNAGPSPVGGDVSDRS